MDHRSSLAVLIHLHLTSHRHLLMFSTKSAVCGFHCIRVLLKNYSFEKRHLVGFSRCSSIGTKDWLLRSKRIYVPHKMSFKNWDQTTLQIFVKKLNGSNATMHYQSSTTTIALEVALLCLETTLGLSKESPELFKIEPAFYICPMEVINRQTLLAKHSVNQSTDRSFNWQLNWKSCHFFPVSFLLHWTNVAGEEML